MDILKCYLNEQYSYSVSWLTAYNRVTWGNLIPAVV